APVRRMRRTLVPGRPRTHRFIYRGRLQADGKLVTTVESPKRNRYLDAMGIDVWVRRPGGALDGVWMASPTTVEAASPAALVEDIVGAVAGPAAGAATAPAVGASASAVSHGAPPVVSPTPTPAPLEMAPAIASAQPLAQPLANGDEAAAWDALRTEVLSCTRCPLHKTRTQGVVGVGPHRTEWIVIGEAPGAEEDRRGEP